MFLGQDIKCLETSGLTSKRGGGGGRKVTVMGPVCSKKLSTGRMTEDTLETEMLCADVVIFIHGEVAARSPTLAPHTG